MPMPKKQFEAWFRSQIYNIDMAIGRCRKIVLRHRGSASRTGNAVYTVDIPSDSQGEVSDMWIQEMVKTIEEMAQGDADGRGGCNNYMLQSYHGEKEEPSNTFAMRMFGDEGDEADGLSSEPASAKGIVGMTMRHLEAVMRINAMNNANHLQTTQRMIDKQEQVIEKLLNEKYENFSLIESLLSQKNEREIAAAKAAQDMELKEKTMDKLMLMAPIALNAFVGKKNGNQKALPESTSPAEMQIAALAETIRPDQLEKLQSVLDTEQMMVIVNLFIEAKKKAGGQVQQTNLLQNKEVA